MSEISLRNWVICRWISSIFPIFVPRHAILNGGVLCYHYVWWRAGGRMASTSLTTFILDTIWPIHMGLHICMLYGQNSAFHVFLVPSPQCSPQGSQRSTFQISHDNWSQSWPILMKLHGCIPWSGPMVPIVLLHDTMNYVPLAAILNLLKIDFFYFCWILGYNLANRYGPSYN